MPAKSPRQPEAENTLRSAAAVERDPTELAPPPPAAVAAVCMRRRTKSSGYTTVCAPIPAKAPQPTKSGADGSAPPETAMDLVKS